MSNIKLGLCGSFFSMAAGLLFAVMFVPASAGAGSAVIGSVAITKNSTVGGLPLPSNSVIFSGDTLEVKDGATAIALTAGSRLTFGRDTAASFLRGGDEVTVLLAQGSIALFHPESTEAVRIKVGSYSVVPTKGFKTLGLIAMLDRGLVVTSKEGSLRIEGNGLNLEVAKDRTIMVPLKAARAPQGTSASAGAGGSKSSMILSVSALGVGTLATIVGFVGISRANDATNAANRATGTAASAVNTAGSAASAAASAVQAAQAASSLAAAVATASLAEMNIVGCELNAFANSEGKASPYTPPDGLKCP
jgi:hypothetical protein